MEVAPQHQYVRLLGVGAAVQVRQLTGSLVVAGLPYADHVHFTN